MKQYDYTGKVVFIGIDVHKKTYSCVAICEKTVIKRDTMPASPEQLLRYLKNNFSEASEIHTAYEAGFSGFHLHRYLVDQGIKNIVVHPGSIEIAPRNRVKTDKRDALKIATQLSAGRLRCVFIPEEHKEEMRAVTRLRTAILRMRHKTGAQFKALLFTKGLIEMEDDKKVSPKWLSRKMKEVKELGYSNDFYYCVSLYAEQWLSLNDQIKAIDNKLGVQANQEKGLQILYESVPGIGPIHGRQLANELGDMTQFKNEKNFYSYLGLTPTEHSSGEHTRQGHITRQGKSMLRHIFVEAAWTAIMKDPSLKEVFDRLAAKRGKRRAIVGVARRLAGRVRSCILTGVLYEIKPTKEACSLHKKVA